ncbi:hypothetical protein HNP65_000374 [Thermosipho japonicus]|uniref:Uncharacterized protein n=1 Tax=Thermosipho japonicus TaxID=90323 RepID=A0A841GEH9_9BACT|nr:hypothetical protein [Thermosipho japonicus]MBB6061952.1 hypothetical protein [Thermosipho japonicus]
MKKIENLFEITLKEKSGGWFFWFFLLFIPHLNLFSIFFISNLLLASKIKNKKDKSFYYLPFTKKDVFFILYLLLVLLISSTSFFNLLLISRYSLKYILGPLIFSTAIYSIGIIASSLNGDNFAITILFIIFDAILSNLGSPHLGINFNPYILISPIRQESLIGSLLFSLALLFIAFKLYVGGESYVKN